MAEKMYSVPQAASRLGISPMTMQKIIDAKQITAYEVNGRWKIPESGLQRYLQEHSNQQDDGKGSSYGIDVIE